MRRVTLAALVGTFVLLSVSNGLAVDREWLRWMRSRPAIDSIVIEGNAGFSDSEIRKRLYSRSKNLWLVIRGDRRYRVQRETYGRDTLEVKYLYLTNGFIGVKVTEIFEPLADSSALLRMTIDEGRQFFYGEKNVTGEAEHGFIFQSQKIADRLKSGKPVNYFDLQQTTFDMKSHMANHGHPYARVTYKVDTSGESVALPIEFLIEPDSLVRFGNVTVEGTSKFPQNVALRELKIKQGAVYRRDDIIASQRRLFESGYFSTHQLRMREDTPDRLNPDFTLRVRERKPRYLWFKTGAGQSEVRDLIWDVSSGFGQRNFLGSRRYELAADYSFSLGSDSRLITHRYRIRFTEPWPIGIRMPLSLSFEVSPRVKDPTNDFDKRSWTAAATTRMQYGQRIHANLGIEYQFVKISGVPEEQVTKLRQLTENTARRKIFAVFRRDSRDDIFIPSRGVVVDLSAEFYGGFLHGDEDFYKIQASWSRYERVWPGWIAATRLKGSWSDAFGQSEEVPLDEVIYLGGASTVRGFQENALGRFMVGAKPVGARYTFVINQEFRWRTLQVFNVIPLLKDLMKSFPLWQSVFFDMGNGFRRRREIGWNSLAYSYGTGIQIVSPAGPIRIDYARRISTDEIDSGNRWHFTILYAF